MKKVVALVLAVLMCMGCLAGCGAANAPAAQENGTPVRTEKAVTAANEQELREYLILNMKRDEEGYYYSAIQEEGQPPIRSKYLHMFEMDHIVPISKGGLTVKENLQMITRIQNRKKGANTAP